VDFEEWFHAVDKLLAGFWRRLYAKRHRAAGLRAQGSKRGVAQGSGLRAQGSTRRRLRAVSRRHVTWAFHVTLPGETPAADARVDWMAPDCAWKSRVPGKSTCRATFRVYVHR